MEQETQMLATHEKNDRQEGWYKMNITVLKIKQWIVEGMLACSTVFDRTTS
jgi:hypothetical protein